MSFLDLFKKKLAPKEEPKLEGPSEHYLIEDTDGSKIFYSNGILSKKITVHLEGRVAKSFFANPLVELKYKWENLPGLNLASTHRPVIKYYHVERLGLLPIHTIQLKK
jgi:hypothetical protein